MQRIERDIYSISLSPEQPGISWVERLARLVTRPERKAKIDPDSVQSGVVNDHMQTLMVTDLFLRR